MSVWMVIGAIAIALVIAWLGLTALRAASGPLRGGRPRPERAVLLRARLLALERSPVRLVQRTLDAAPRRPKTTV